MNINYISNLTQEAAITRDAVYPHCGGAEIRISSYDELKDMVVYTFNGDSDSAEQKVWVLTTDDGWRVLWVQCDIGLQTGADFLSSAWHDLPWYETEERIFEEFEGMGWVMLSMPGDEEEIISLLGGSANGVTAVMVRDGETWASRSFTPYLRGVFYRYG